MRIAALDVDNRERLVIPGRTGLQLDGPADGLLSLIERFSPYRDGGRATGTIWTGSVASRMPRDLNRLLYL